MKPDIFVGTDIDQFSDYALSRWFSGHDPKNPTQERDLPIMALGLAGETGEALEHIKKLIRDGTWDREAFIKEMGDQLFYFVRILRYFTILPSEVMAANIEKLESRRARGTMRGSGDNR